MFKNFIQKKLEKYTQKYIAKHRPKIVFVTGSVGKTTTKLAIATILNEKYRVRVHAGNHNTHLSVPLAILGINYPDNIRSLGAWLKVRRASLKRIKSKTNDCDVIVQELGTDKPGDILYFGTYLAGDIAVVTAVSPEHMEYFDSLDLIAQEELAVSNFSGLTMINRDDIAPEFAKYITTPHIDTYGLGGVAEYRFETSDKSLLGANGQMIMPGQEPLKLTLKVSSESGVKAVVAAAAVASRLGVDVEQIKAGAAKITNAPGRMNILAGLRESVIIDDTYNSSPLAVEAALQALYSESAPQRIAILGDMNEMGGVSAPEHEKIGRLCNPSLLDWVITVGPQSHEHLAPAAILQGCQVKSFNDPISAGAFAHSVLGKNAVVLAKGSQNGIFVEEALKILLHNSEDETQLVRQSPAWLEKKHKQFDKF